MSEGPLRVAVVLPGLGRVQRGAETAFLELSARWARSPGVSVHAFGSGDAVPEGVVPHTVGCVSRERFERWPKFPALRSEYEYEELTFVWNLARSRMFQSRRHDVAVHCSYPYVNWFLNRGRESSGLKSVFVTQNGDWPARENRREYRYFRCDGLVCTNPEYHERHKAAFTCELIPNGVDPDVFTPSVEPDKDPRLPGDKPVVLMASAMIPSKGVLDGIRAVAGLDDAFLVVLGDGPQRAEATELAGRLLPGRHLLLGSVPRSRMAGLYRRADAFLHMSRDEPFGIVYLEAGASGLPVVAHDGPNVRWILGDAAKLADTADIGAVTGALREALADRERLGRLARQRVAGEWTWDAQAERYLAFLRRVSCSRS